MTEKESCQDMNLNLWFTFDARVNNIISCTQSYCRDILPYLEELDKYHLNLQLLVFLVQVLKSWRN